MLLAAIIMTMTSVAIIAGNTTVGGAGTPTPKSVPVKKLPKNHKDYGKDVARVPSQVLYCSISLEEGIQPIDTSDVYSYEVWDINDSFIIANFDDENDFIEFVLGYVSECIIKLHTPEYIYMGYIEP